MNKIVYSTDKSIDVAPMQATVQRKGQWAKTVRVTKERHAAACSALRMHYASKAASLGMTLEGYMARFNVKF